MASILKKGHLLLLCSLYFPLHSFSQNWEVGLLAGPSYNYGAVSNTLAYQNIRYNIMGFVRKHISQRVVIRGNIGYIRIAGIDSISSNQFQKDRNLNFYTDIFELSAQVEYNFVDDKTRGRRIKNYTIPYVFAGIGMSYFIPQTVFNQQTYNLAQLQTSGISYNQFTFVIPVGAGVRYYLTHHWQVGFEAGMRFTGTSDLDDIRSNSVYPDPAKLPNNTSRMVYDRSPLSANLDPGTGFGKPGALRGETFTLNDIYFTFGVTLSYKFGFVRGNRFRGRVVHCPRFY
jgi:hypothetical protein